MKNFLAKNKYVSFVLKYRWIWLTIFFLWEIVSIGFKIKVGGYQVGHIDGINGEGIYNLFFPLVNLGSGVFPFRSVMHFLWDNCPKFLQDFRNMYFLLPMALSMSVAAIAYPANMRIAGAVSLFLSFIMIKGTYLFFNIEQSIIACCILMSVGAFYILKDHPRLRIASISAALCACMHSKGVCFPYCLMIFAMLFYESFKTKRNIRFLSLCFAVFLLVGLAWSINASEPEVKFVLFTEESNRLIPNLVGGAHGLIQTIEGDVGEAFNIENSTLMQTVIYCAKTIIRHPFNYIKAILLRIIWLSEKISFFAPLFVLFVCSYFKLQCLRKFPILFMAATYFFGIYIIMPVEPRYFIPAVFLMCSCSAVFLSDYIMALTKKLESKNLVMPEESKSLTVSPQLFKSLSEYIIEGTVLLHFAAWSLSIFLLITFPYRFALFDSESFSTYFEHHPDNVFFAMYPFRKDYPLMRDYDGMLNLYRNIGKNKCPLEVKKHWFDFLAGRDEQQKLSPQCELEVYWQEILLSAFKDIERGGNLEKGIYDIQTSLLTCMLSSGYIRQDKGELHSGQMRDLSDRMAMSKAEVCAASYEEFIFDLSDDIHKKLKHTLLHSKAYDMMFPDKVREMFMERNSEKCTSCCVSHGGGAPPDKCGFTDYVIPMYDQSLRGVVPLYTYNDILSEARPVWIYSIGTLYSKISATSNKEQRNRRIDSAIRLLESYLSIYDEEINKKLEESPDMLGLSHLRNRPEATYNLAILYYLKGDMKKSKKYVLDTLEYSKGIKVSYNLKRLMNLYRKVQ